MYLGRAFVIVILIATGCGAAERGVFDRDGSIFLNDESGKVVKLTATGRDFDPWLTVEGDAVLFVRSDVRDMFRTAIYEIDLKSSQERLIFSGPVQVSGQDFWYLGGPEFDQARRTLYVLAKTSVTTGDLYAVDLAAKRSRHLVDAAGYDVIRSGPNAGNLLVNQRKTSIALSIYYVYWLYSPNGKDLGIAGPGDLNLWEAIDPDRWKVMTESEVQPHQPEKAQGSDGEVPAQIVDRDVMAARLAKYVAPEYPATAKAAGANGVIEFLIRISRDGDVVDAKFVSGHPALVEAARTAVTKWKYHPFMVNGKAVDVTTVADVRFSSR